MVRLLSHVFDLNWATKLLGGGSLLCFSASLSARLPLPPHVCGLGFTPLSFDCHADLLLFTGIVHVVDIEFNSIFLPFC